MTIMNTEHFVNKLLAFGKSFDKPENIQGVCRFPFPQTFQDLLPDLQYVRLYTTENTRPRTEDDYVEGYRYVNQTGLWVKKISGVWDWYVWGSRCEIACLLEDKATTIQYDEDDIPF